MALCTDLWWVCESVLATRDETLSKGSRDEISTGTNPLVLGPRTDRVLYD